MRLVVLGISCSILLAGCSNGRAADEATGRAAAELAALKRRVDSLQQRIASLEIDKWLAATDKIAYLTPGSDGYSVVRSDLGYLTVALNDIAPYANGSRITLQFGNPTSATINGAKAKLDWGRVTTEGITDNVSARSREITFTESLRSGSWTNVRVVLEGVPPQELGFVRVKDVEHTGIRLSRY